MKGIWKWILLIIIIIIVFFFPEILLFVADLIATSFPAFAAALTSMAGFLAASVPWWGALAIAFGLSYLVDPAGTTEIATDIGQAVGSIAGALVGGALTGVGSAIGSGTLLLIGGGLLLFWLVKRNKDDKEEDDQSSQTPYVAPADDAAGEAQ